MENAPTISDTIARTKQFAKGTTNIFREMTIFPYSGQTVSIVKCCENFRGWM